MAFKDLCAGILHFLDSSDESTRARSLERPEEVSEVLRWPAPMIFAP